MQPQINYQAEKCSCCGQSLSYVLPLDRGSVEILKAFISAVKKKGKNEIHPRNEMEVHLEKGQSPNLKNGELSSNQVGNLSRPRFHGLIAKIKDKRGYYCITNKGVDFLKGFSIPKYAIVSKKTSKNCGYYQENLYRVVIKDFSSDDERWEFPNIEIIDGDVKERKIIQDTLFKLSPINYKYAGF